MKMKLSSAAVALAAPLSALASPAAAREPPPQQVSYDGYGVFRVPVGDDVAQVAGLVDALGLETWKPARRPGAPADVVVPPGKRAAFLDAVAAAGIGGVEVMHDDLGASVELEQQPAMGLDVLDASLAAVNATWFAAYHSYADHLAYFGALRAQYPDHVDVVTAGESLQGNAITGLHIYGAAGKGVRPAVVFHGTVHAREWITTMVVEYFAEALLGNYSVDAETKSFVDQYDFYFFPVVNPDGFLYSQSSDRLWRKNRQATAGSTCLGHDINRNWPYQWDVAGGASTSPCAQDFRGAAAGDAPETQALRAQLDAVRAAQGLRLYVDWHAYSQLFMTPYGYSCAARPAADDEYRALAAGASAAIASVFGTRYASGPICDTIYQVSGGSVDYASDVTGADYVFTVELRDTGRYGFVLPASQILPSGQEAYEGVKYLLRNMK